MILWEAPEVVESDEELIECAKKHGFYIYKKNYTPRIRLKPCVCGNQKISTRVYKYSSLPDYGKARCFCVECGLRVQTGWDGDEEIDWDKLEQKARIKWNETITNIYEKQRKEIV